MRLHCRRACVGGVINAQTGMNSWLSCAAARVKVGLRWSCCPVRQWAILVGGLSGGLSCPVRQWATEGVVGALLSRNRGPGPPNAGSSAERSVGDLEPVEAGRDSAGAQVGADELVVSLLVGAELDARGL